jgi:hypothetical protein
MKKILFLLIITFLISCDEATTTTTEKETTATVQQETEQESVEVEEKIPFIPVDPNRASLDFLRDLEGKYAFDSKLFETEPMKNRLEKLMAHKYKDFLQRMDVQVLIIQGDLVIIKGLMAHRGGTEEAILVVDLPKNLMWVGILENGKKVTHLNEDGNLPMPPQLFRTILDWKS